MHVIIYGYIIEDDAKTVRLSVTYVTFGDLHYCRTYRNQQQSIGDGLQYKCMHALEV